LMAHSNYSKNPSQKCLLTQPLCCQRCWIPHLILYCLWVTNRRYAARVPAKPLGEDGILNQNPIFEMSSSSIYKKGRVVAGPASFLISLWRIELF
jgi:hypothetical protein